MSSRLIHPCYKPIISPSGTEHSTWANLTPRYDHGDDVISLTSHQHLVTAHANSIRIYAVNSHADLICLYKFDDLAGNIISLHVLPGGDANAVDELLIGFSGLPRLSVVKLVESDEDGSLMLKATSIIDFTSSLNAMSMGAMAPLLEEDMLVCVNSCPLASDKDLSSFRSRVRTAAVVLGGGVSVAVFQIHRDQSSDAWSSDPFILNLRELSSTMGFLVGLTAPLSGTNTDLSASRSRGKGNNQNKSSHSSNEASICSGFGDILDIVFLSGYASPTIAILHAPRGVTWSGRLSSSSTALAITAISVTVEHKSSVILWSCGAICNDARYILSVPQPLGGCLVVSPNVVSHIHHGTVCGCLAFNGFAHISCPPELLIDQSSTSKKNRGKYPHSCLSSNPDPLPLLSTQLDGSRAIFVKPSIALLSDREGQLFSLELHPGNNEKRTDVKISSVPLSCMLSSPPSSFALTMIPDVTIKIKDALKINKETNVLRENAGILFSGSMMGESHLLGFSIGLINLNRDNGDGIQVKRKLDEDITKNARIKVEDLAGVSSVISTDDENKSSSIIEDDKFLYEGYPDPVSTINEKDIVTDDEIFPQDLAPKLKRAVKLIHTFTFSMLDSITSFGCLGYSCRGPCYSAFSAPLATEEIDETETKVLNNDHLISCGTGENGGLAILSSIGETETSEILFEIDLIGAQDIFLLPLTGTTIITKGEGIKPIVLQKEKDAHGIIEVSIDNWCKENANAKSMFDDPRSLLHVNLFGAKEVQHDGHIYFLFLASFDAEYAIVCLEFSSIENQVSFRFSKLLDVQGSQIASAYIGDEVENNVSISAVLSNGRCLIVVVNTSNYPFDVKEKTIGTNGESDKIVATDIFVFDSELFIDPNEVCEEKVKMDANAKEMNEFDDLYGTSDEINCPDLDRGKDIGLAPKSFDFESYQGFKMHCIVVCRKNGVLQIFNINHLQHPVWEIQGCGMGPSILDPKRPYRDMPNTFHVSEVRFFVAGPIVGGPGARRLCFLVRSSNGDLQLYSARKQNKGMLLYRECLDTISRNSSETKKHRLKLKRRGLLSEYDKDERSFEKNELHRFSNISCQSGLFSIGPRPCWFIAERGVPMVLNHRLRFATPGVPRPLVAFCSDRQQGSFFTIHERLGRSGSQRLSMWNGLRDVFETKKGFLPGGGYFGRKVQLGVTVNRIEYINDESLASSGHPLYVMLISYETKKDQADLNDDGLTDEERKQIQDEKVAEKTKRQVEADLGGYDIEDFEREDAFKIERKYGEAPPIQSEKHELWLVDANGWKVIDKFELDEYEHGLSLEVVSLTEVQEDGDSTSSKFIAVGTGKVDEDAEDSECVGRLLLFEVVDRDFEDKRFNAGESVELQLTYEKAMQMGPVTCLTNLNVDNKTRLVVGAGAEVTVEQWTGSYLLQVGFFHANMHVFHMTFMKGFLLLSDAYDSLHFLVWRESDKSLTLLAKDYEPTAVYASGILSRGGAMAFLSHDDRGNMECMQYAPKDDGARGGNKLVRRADFYVGTQTVSMSSHWCRSSLLCYTSNLTSTWAALQRQDAVASLNDDNRRFASNFGTVDGGLSAIIPVSEQVYWRMTALQSVMSNALQTHCGLNFRSWRLFHRSSRRGACQAMERKKGFLDGSLLLKFSSLPIYVQEELASAIGSTVDLIMDNLLEMDCASLL